MKFKDIKSGSYFIILDEFYKNTADQVPYVIWLKFDNAGKTNYNCVNPITGKIKVMNPNITVELY